VLVASSSSAPGVLILTGRFTALNIHASDALHTL
jgi:hypothetical protein